VCSCVLQCGAVWCSVLQCGVAWCSMIQWGVAVAIEVLTTVGKVQCSDL